MGLMGLREYGRHAGLSHVGVLKAIRSGRIQRTPEGLIDSDQADRDLRARTHPVGKVHRTVPRLERAAGPADDFGFSRARAVREHYEALLAKAEYEEKVEKLLSADEVKIVRYRIDQAFREHMLRVPDGVIGRLRACIWEHGAAPDSHTMHVILSEEIRAALVAFADEMVAGAAEPGDGVVKSRGMTTQAPTDSACLPG
jgi:hypothetical protein